MYLLVYGVIGPRALNQIRLLIDAECEVVETGLGHGEWQEMDRRLREYAHRRSALDAAEAFDLVRAEQLKIYVSFGFVSLYDLTSESTGRHTTSELGRRQGERRM